MAAATTKVAVALVDCPLVGDTVELFGHIRVGGKASRTVIVCDPEAIMPAAV